MHKICPNEGGDKTSQMEENIENPKWRRWGIPNGGAPQMEDIEHPQWRR